MPNSQVTSPVPVAAGSYSAAVSILALANQGARIALDKTQVSGPAGDLVLVYGVEDLTILAGSVLPPGAVLLGQIGAAAVAGQGTPNQAFLAPIVIPIGTPLPAGLVFFRSRVGAGVHALAAIVTGDPGAAAGPAGAPGAPGPAGPVLEDISVPLPFVAAGPALAQNYLAARVSVGITIPIGGIRLVPGSAMPGIDNVNYSYITVAVYDPTGAPVSIPVTVDTRPIADGGIGPVGALEEFPLGPAAALAVAAGNTIVVGIGIPPGGGLGAQIPAGGIAIARAAT